MSVIVDGANDGGSQRMLSSEAESQSTLRQRCRQLLVDEPRWVEANAMLNDETTGCLAVGDGFVLVHPLRNMAIPLGVAPHNMREIFTTFRTVSILCNDDTDGLLELAGDCQRDLRPMQFMVLGDEHFAAHHAPDAATLLSPDDSLDHVDSTVLREELNRAKRVWTVRVDGLPVSFAYAAWRSERFVALAVDTLQPYRQRGLATIAASAVIGDELASGNQPVWSVIVDNIASMQLAHRLGFEVHSGAAVVLPSSHKVT
jgi:uncharacterized membrane protein